MSNDIRRTLVFLLRNDEVLLGMKKRGFGAGRWNGFGGKLEEGETHYDAAARECREEALVNPVNLKDRGMIAFRFDDGMALDVYIFSATEWNGEPSESEEMLPKWFKLEQVPYDSMWPDDPIWLPLVLEGKDVCGECYFADMNTIKSHTIRAK